MSGGNILNWARRLSRVADPKGSNLYTQAAGDIEPQGRSLLSDVEFAGYVVDIKTANYTILPADSGKVIDMAADAKVITLPAALILNSVIIRNAGNVDGAVEVTVAPNASDSIIGLGFTAADDKDAINTKATALVGDFIWLMSNGTTGWNVVAARGIWAREA